MKVRHADIKIGNLYEVFSEKFGGFLGFCLILANGGKGICIGAFFCQGDKQPTMEIDLARADLVLQFSDLDIVDGKWPVARDATLKYPVKPGKFLFKRSTFSGHHFLEEYDEKVKLVREVRVQESDVGDFPESTLFGSGAVAIRMNQIRSG